MRKIIYPCSTILTLMLFAASMLTPWAQGRTILVLQTVYAYQNKTLLAAVIAGVVLFVIFLLLMHKKSLFVGLMGIVTGGLVVSAGAYLWQWIQNDDIYLVFKFVSVKPAIGAAFYILAGVVIIIFGLIYFFDVLATRLFSKSKK